jgi:hypothetical protein
MYGSRYLILAAVFAAAVAMPGCKRDLQVPEPKTANAAMSHPAAIMSGSMLPPPRDSGRRRRSHFITRL